MAKMLHPNKIPSPTWRLQRSYVQHEIYSPKHRLHWVINCVL